MTRTDWLSCRVCDGTGTRFFFKHTKPCQACDGTGRIPRATEWRPWEPSEEVANG